MNTNYFSIKLEKLFGKLGKRKKTWCVTLGNFRAVKTPTMANFKLPI